MSLESLFQRWTVGKSEAIAVTLTKDRTVALNPNFEKAHLVGDYVQLLLLLALDILNALQARQIRDPRPLHQRRDLLARQRDAGQHDGQLPVDRPLLLLPDQPRRERGDVVLVPLRLRPLLDRQRARRVHFHGCSGNARVANMRRRSTRVPALCGIESCEPVLQLGCRRPAPQLVDCAWSCRGHS
jgi:hypothetical protein